MAHRQRSFRIAGRNRPFTRAEGMTDKEKAKSRARMARENGLYARVIPVEKTSNGKKTIVGYELWYNDPGRMQGRMMSHSDLQMATREYAKKKRSILAMAEEYERTGTLRNTGKRTGLLRRRKRTVSDKRDLKQVELFVETRDKLMNEKGKNRVEAEQLASDFSARQRTKEESLAKQKKENKAKEKELKIKKQELAIARWDADVADFRAPVPGREVVKYNSLEIAGATIGTAGGIALTSAGVAAMPWVPVAVATGFFGAKLVRRNVLDIGLKDGVNWMIDKTEGAVEATADSLRISKDDEIYPSSANPKTLWLLRRPKKKPNPNDPRYKP